MKKIDIAKLNRANKDIWILIDAGLKVKNFAILEKNLKRLHSLQSYYADLLNLNDFEIKGLENDLTAERYQKESFEREWMEEVAKRTGTFDRMKERIDEIFKT